MEGLGIGVLAYLAIGLIVSAFRSNSSWVDVVLDVVLFPVIIVYYFKHRSR